VVPVLDIQVQSDHYEEFFAPELEKHGYTGVYKKKTGEVRITIGDASNVEEKIEVVISLKFDIPV
jgi:mRNA deadenylase 3'-5' endonuclease subunit Ccr4